VLQTAHADFLEVLQEAQEEVAVLDDSDAGEPLPVNQQGAIRLMSLVTRALLLCNSEVMTR
jgi:hypothetical protein